MTKSIKKLMATGMAVMAIASAAVSVTVFAKDKPYSFSVTTSQNDGMGFSAGNPKDDDEQTAYVYTTSGNIIEDDLFYMAVFKSPINDDSNRVTYWNRITSNNGKYLIDYKTWRGKNSTNYLCGDTDKYSVSVEGHWFS